MTLVWRNRGRAPHPLFGEGEEMRDHLYCYRRRRQHPAKGDRAKIDGNAQHGDRELAQFPSHRRRIATACNAVVAPSMRNNPITHRHFDVTALLTAFPDIRFTPFEQGLDRTLAAALEAAHA
jgi:hypothetical protein